ncbi:condensation domain-containing protein [Bacillus velezensis]|uniref:condensation domain-containing protein n=1 Tax=Bacillus velezensis TaxID=492670 RepID=UPI0037BF25C2
MHLHIFQAADDEKAHLIIQPFINPFHLSPPPLIPPALLTLNENKHLLLLHIHHIIPHPLSTTILLKHLPHLYKPPTLPSPNLHYKHFPL